MSPGQGWQKHGSTWEEEPVDKWMETEDPWAQANKHKSSSSSESVNQSSTSAWEDKWVDFQKESGAYQQAHKRYRDEPTQGWQCHSSTWEDEPGNKWMETGDPWGQTSKHKSSSSYESSNQWQSQKGWHSSKEHHGEGWSDY